MHVDFLLFNDKDKVSSILPASLKRRLNFIGESFFDSLQLLDKKEPFPWVVASRHGDSNRMISLFERICNKEESSPTDFSLSVHNALIGLYSIFKKNTHPHTSLAAGEHTFAMGFFESYVQCLTLQQKVGYIYYDSALPLYGFSDPFKNIFCVFVFSPSEGSYKIEKQDAFNTITTDAVSFIQSATSLYNRIDLPFCTFMLAEQK